MTSITNTINTKTRNNMNSRDPINVATKEVLAKTPEEVKSILAKHGVAVIALPVELHRS